MDKRKLAKAFKALSHPNRLQIYQEILRRRSLSSKDFAGCALTDFISALNVGAPTVSHHIKELVNADLISVEKQGKFVTCFLNEATCEYLQLFFRDKGSLDKSSLDKGSLDTGSLDKDSRQHHEEKV